MYELPVKTSAVYVQGFVAGMSPFVSSLERRQVCGLACSAIVVAALTCPSVAIGTRMDIRVLNVSQARGTLRVALCRETEWEGHRCRYGAQTAAKTGVVALSVEVPPGVYGVLVHHDVNSNNRIDKNVLGVPVEGVGFSRNPRLFLGFPSFSSVSVPIAGDAASTAVTLSFEPSGASSIAK